MNRLPENLPVYLINADYAGFKKAIRLTFYEPKSQRLYVWYDDSHDPYCLTNLSPFELDKIGALKKHPSFKGFEVVEKYDALSDQYVTVTKINAKDPKAIGGGKPEENIRNIIPDYWADYENPAKVWEARVPYVLCYIYDKGLEMGMPYQLSDGVLVPIINKEIEGKIGEILDKIDPEERRDRWVRLFEYPIPDFRRVALDIEVLGEAKTKVPDTYKAQYPVISVCLIGSDGKRRILVLLRKGVEVGNEVLPEGTGLEFYDKELDLIKAVFKYMLEYPFVITFNGDNFDFAYLYYRAQKLQMKKEEIPLIPSRRGVHIIGSIHIDLYRLFFNRSLKNYAFQGKYKEISLDAIAHALLGKGKLVTHKGIQLSTEMAGWSYSQLAKYNCQDGDITLELTTYNDSLVIKLILCLMRISGLPIGDLHRAPISQWIRSMLYYEHRRRNYLIPNRNDILSFPNKGTTTTKAMIKGKKYKGAIVVEPVAGTHFNVKVIDFASLYPSIMKVKNLGYSTINCPHEECKDNKIPQTSHWVCKKNRAMESEILGLLKDLRVEWYKKKRKGNPWYSVIEQSIKVFLNASYGVFGAESFDLYCPPVSESVTAVGRHSIMQTIDKAKEIGVEVLYGDTDSIFLKDPLDEQINTLIKWSTEALDLDLEVDKEYRFVCLSSRKKNYLGVTPDGTVDVKGMTGKKKHVPNVIRGAFSWVQKDLAQPKSPEEVEAMKKGVKQVIRTVYLTIKRRQFELKDMAFHYTLGKNPHSYDKSTPQHVKAALMLEKEGIELKKGERVSFIKCKGDPNVKPLQLARKEDIDVGKYLEMLQSTFEQLLDPLGIDFDRIIGVTKLDQFT